MIRVIIVDDHPVVRRGLKQIIEEEPDMQVVNQAGNPECYLRNQPDRLRRSYPGYFPAGSKRDRGPQSTPARTPASAGADHEYA